MEHMNQSIKSKGVVQMLYEDKHGRLLMPEEVDELSPWEIEEKRIHISDMFQ